MTFNTICEQANLNNPKINTQNNLRQKDRIVSGKRVEGRIAIYVTSPLPHNIFLTDLLIFFSNAIWLWFQ